MVKERKEENRDELGFTPSDYKDMQKLAEREGKLGDDLQDGWDITPEQIALINIPCHPLHRVAVIAFYDVNYERLRRMACGYLTKSRNFYILAIVSYEDLLHQVFCDLLAGDLKLPLNIEKISRAIYKSFYYAAVGGLQGVENVKGKRALCSSV